jgi:hypothetical protein
MTVDRMERDRLELLKAARTSQPAAVRRLPASFPLDFAFDVQLLARELDGVTAAGWGAQRTASAGAVVERPNEQWRVLALRSVAGDPQRTDAGGAEFGLTDWTPHASQFMAIRSFLMSLPIELQTVRFMALEPGGSSPEHVDSCVGFSWARVRLHVPLKTSPSAYVAFDGESVHWDQRLWYGSFSLPHRIENCGSETRIHLVIDGVPNAGFLDLLPRTVRELLEPDDVLIPEPFRPAEQGAVPLVPGEFDMPRTFLNLAAPVHDFVDSTDLTRVRIEPISGSALAMVEGRGAPYVLLRTGPDAYRILGWPHKSMEFFTSPFGLGARLGTRVGPSTYSRTVTAVPR